MLDQPIGEATQAAEGIFGDVSTWSPVGTATATAAGGFEFPSVEEIDQVLSSWRERLESITARANTLNELSNGFTNVPAEDDSTVSYMATWSQSFSQLRDQHESMRAYIENYIQKLEAAKAAKETGEQESTDAVHKAGGGINQ